MEVTHELLTKDGETSQTHGIQLIPIYPDEILLFLHIQSNNERNLKQLMTPIPQT